MPQAKKTGIVSRIIATIKGGDEKNVTDFIYKVEKTLNSEIKAAKLEADKLALDYESNKTELGDKISDLRDSVEDALVNINPDSIKTSQGRADYVIRYIDNYEDKIRALDRAESELLENESRYKDQIKDLNLQIEAKEAIIEKITK